MRAYYACTCKRVSQVRAVLWLLRTLNQWTMELRFRWCAFSVVYTCAFTVNCLLRFALSDICLFFCGTIVWYRCILSRVSWLVGPLKLRVTIQLTQTLTTELEQLTIYKLTAGEPRACHLRRSIDSLIDRLNNRQAIDFSIAFLLVHHHGNFRSSDANMWLILSCCKLGCN